MWRKDSAPLSQAPSLRRTSICVWKMLTCVCAARLFQWTMPKSWDQGVIWCHMRVPTVMMILPGCQILPSAMALPCVFSPLFVRGSEKDSDGLMKEWTFRMGRICPHSPSRRALTRPDAAKSSRTRSADMLRLWWRNALINFMLCVDFLCMDARIVAFQRVVSHASWAESHGHSLQGRLRRGVSCPRSAGPALLWYDQLEQQETWTLKHHGNITAPPRGCDISGKLRR